MNGFLIIVIAICVITIVFFFVAAYSAYKYNKNPKSCSTPGSYSSSSSVSAAPVKTMSTSELMQTAKSLCDKRSYYLEKYKDDLEYEKLEKALNALPTAYNRWVQQILGAPMVGKAPINPFVASAVGYGVGGIVGGVAMGVAAQNETDKYKQRVEVFQKQLASINGAGEKVAFLVDEINSIVGRSVMHESTTYIPKTASSQGSSSSKSGWAAPRAVFGQPDPPASQPEQNQSSKTTQRLSPEEVLAQSGDSGTYYD